MATKPTLPPSIWAENRPTLPPTTDSQWGQGLQYTATTSGGKALTETFDYPLFKIDESLRWLRDLFDENGVVNSLPDATTTQKGVVEKATAEEAKSAASNKFPDAAGVHGAFNQYGLGARGTRLGGNDNILDLSGSSQFFSWEGYDLPVDAPFDRSAVGLVLSGGGDGYLVLNRSTGEQWSYASSGSGYNDWIRSLSTKDIATISDAQAGDNDKVITSDTLAHSTLGSSNYQIIDKTSINEIGIYYTNTTGAPKFVIASTTAAAPPGLGLTVKDKDGAEHDVAFSANIQGPDGNVSFVIPPGWSYKITDNNDTNPDLWTELSL